MSLSLLYWLQTEAPRPDGKTGWRKTRLRGDVVGTGDGLAKYPYVREARRIKAVTTVLVQHCGTDARAAGDTYIDVASLPFQIPLRALVAFAHAQRVRPHAVRDTPALLADYQKRLVGQGVELRWPASALFRRRQGPRQVERRIRPGMFETQIHLRVGQPTGLP